MTCMTPVHGPVVVAPPARAIGPSPVRAGTAGWLVVAAAVPVAAGVLLASGMRLQLASFLPLLLVSALLGTVACVYHRVRPNPRLALPAGLLAMLVLSGLLAGVISHAGLRLHFPLIDPWLDHADRMLGIDTPWLALALDRHAGPALNLIYVSAFPVIFVTALWLGFSGQAGRAWELGLGFAGSILVAAVIAVFFPALGNMAYHHLDGAPGLPEGAGSYYLEAFHYFRDGADPRFSLQQLSGVVEFPSFHMVMALLVPWGLRRTGIAGWIAAIWGALVVLSTIAIGGHYVIDLIGGLLLWAGWMAVARDGRAAPRT